MRTAKGNKFTGNDPVEVAVLNTLKKTQKNTFVILKIQVTCAIFFFYLVVLVFIDIKVGEIEKVELDCFFDGVKTVQDRNAVLSPTV